MLREFVPYSFLECDEHVVPLRLFFDLDGRFMDEELSTDVSPTSEYLVREWKVRPTFLSAVDDASKQEGEDLIEERMTVEQRVRSWGLEPPEGTIFYSGLPGSKIVVRSTEEFLGQLDEKITTLNDANSGEE
ncbi:MAG: hypothetical protein AAGD22_04955 [Verrucomicrobiota bacterium]